MEQYKSSNSADASPSIVSAMLRGVIEQPLEALQLLTQPAETHIIREHAVSTAKALLATVVRR
jgi:hypothetical protein